jgi:hypothetical protein
LIPPLSSARWRWKTVRCCRNLVAAIAVRSRCNLDERSDMGRPMRRDPACRFAHAGYVLFASTKRRS